MAFTRDTNKYLVQRGNGWVYYRRVPIEVAKYDPRYPVIRQALRTGDVGLARKARDLMVSADDALWGALVARDDLSKSVALHKAAVTKARALGFNYQTATQIGKSSPWEDLAGRMDIVMRASATVEDVSAVLGTVDEPIVRFSDALKIYTNEIAREMLAKKSNEQLRKWKVIPERAIRTFVDVVGDVPLAEITREDANKFYRYWLDKIVPKKGGGLVPMSASSGNRQIGELRKIYWEYFNYKDDDRRSNNPFRALSFAEGEKRKRPAFDVEWLTTKFLNSHSLAGLNEEARGVLLASIETGCRPSELCNLDRASIVTDSTVPYIHVKPRKFDGEDPNFDDFEPRELKTPTSERVLPLVGVALEVFRKFPEGFPRYKEREGSACQAINKYLRENDLVPTKKHTLYSVRHTFEDRMIQGGIGDDMRRFFFGHKIDRAKYGSAGGLKWQQGELKKIALPYDAAVV